MDITDFKELAQGIQAIATTVALGVSGFWTYTLFLKRRQAFPRPKIEHQVVIKKLDSTKYLLFATILIVNSSEVLLKIRSGSIWVQQVLPITPEVQSLIERYGEYKHVAPLWGDGGREINWTAKERLDLSLEKRSIIKIEPSEAETICCDFLILLTSLTLL
ncbi:hypothetical protein [Chroococcidiopsis sp.]|uniref:hypothetical protein n=1 Tax=Chroococcidiopsis sp. TaxID=3088168 RepID=UPI003F37A3F8